MVRPIIRYLASHTLQTALPEGESLRSRTGVLKSREAMQNSLPRNGGLSHQTGGKLCDYTRKINTASEGCLLGRARVQRFFDRSAQGQQVDGFGGIVIHSGLQATFPI